MQTKSEAQPQVGVIMGSRSDWATMQSAATNAGGIADRI